MGLNISIDLQSVLAHLGRSYKDETGDDSITSAVASSTGPQYDVALGRGLVASYTSAGTPVSGSDFDILNAFATNLRTLEKDIADNYLAVRSGFLSSQFSKVNSYASVAYGTDIRSYLNSGPGTAKAYNSLTGSVYDVHGGFAQSYLDFNGASLIFKVAEIVMSGSIITMSPGAVTYPGIGGYNRIDVFTISGPKVTISDESVSTSFISGPNSMTLEYAHTGSASFAYILGSSGSYRTLVYPRINNSGYSAPGPTGVGFSGISLNLEKQPAFRYPDSLNTMVLKAKNVNDSGDRDFVFKMVTGDVRKATSDDVEQTQITTVAGAGALAVIVGTTGNTGFYRPFSLVSANNLQNGEVFEIWVSQ